MALAAPLVIMLAIPALASACNYVDGNHCYSVTEWKMPGAGEELRGTKDEIEAYYGSVYYSGFEYVDDEMWDLFTETSWVEAGITWGEGTVHGGSEDNYFYAHETNPSNYIEYAYPEGAPMYDWFGFYIDDPEQNGHWCVTWEWDHTPDWCGGGYPKYTKWVQNGMEDAAKTEEGDADNNGRGVGWKQTLNGGWYKEWTASGSLPIARWNSPACINVPAPGYTYGSVAFSIPGC
jgi:hypothetical protein